MTRLSETVSSEIHQGVGVILIDNPPVNAIAPSVREGIDLAVQQFAADDGVSAVVLHCAGSTFMAGADIRKLGTALTGRPTSHIIESLESLPKPVVAALQGNTLGGGLEYALGCHYRCALPGTRLGLPEVNLGVIPGAGGTQRLPRLLGVERALALITTGDTVTASRALEIGLVDRIIEGPDLLAGALAYARELVAAHARPRRVREMPVTHSASGAASSMDEAFVSAEKSAMRSRRGELAPLKAIEAVRAALQQPFADGMLAEARLFGECRASPQSRALQHLFFAERRSAKLAGVDASIVPRPIRQAGVLGGGTMGRGIVMALANSGIAVTLVETDAAALERSLAQIDSVYATSVSKGRLTAEQRAAHFGRISGRVGLEAFAAVDLVIEAVFEDMALKKRIFADLDRICRPGAILATNTSALDIDAIASATARPQDVLGLHFFSPAHVMKLVEVVRGKATAQDVLVSSMSLIKTMRKTGVIAGNCDGFIGNRMLIGYRRESEFVLLEGASPTQVDRALVGFGMSMGPHTMGDMAGLDVSAAGRRRRRAEGRLPMDERFGVIPDKLVEAGRFGQKTSAGYYKYVPGSHEAIPDPEVDALIEAEAKRLGVTRRPISDDEIVARCIYPLINESARILEEGMAQRPSDIDVVWTSGYGFPRVRGGPMQYADEIGLPVVLETLRRYQRELGPLYWQPAKLIEQLVAEGRDFRSLNE